MFSQITSVSGPTVGVVWSPKWEDVRGVLEVQNITPYKYCYDDVNTREVD